MSRKKGNAVAVRQNFSMHPDLIKSIIDVANALNIERVDDIIFERGLRVTYSKVAAALVWQLQRDYLTPEGKITDALRRLMADYEATDYEKTDAPDADAIMEKRKSRASHIPLTPYPVPMKLDLDRDSSNDPNPHHGFRHHHLPSVSTDADDLEEDNDD